MAVVAELNLQAVTARIMSLRCKNTFETGPTTKAEGSIRITRSVCGASLVSIDHAFPTSPNMLLIALIIVFCCGGVYDVRLRLECTHGKLLKACSRIVRGRIAIARLKCRS